MQVECFRRVKTMRFILYRFLGLGDTLLLLSSMEYNGWVKREHGSLCVVERRIKPKSLVRMVISKLDPVELSKVQAYPAPLQMIDAFRLQLGVESTLPCCFHPVRCSSGSSRIGTDPTMAISAPTHSTAHGETDTSAVTRRLARYNILADSGIYLQCFLQVHLRFSEVNGLGLVRCSYLSDFLCRRHKQAGGSLMTKCTRDQGSPHNILNPTFILEQGPQHQPTRHEDGYHDLRPHPAPGGTAERRQQCVPQHVLSAYCNPPETSRTFEPKTLCRTGTADRRGPGKEPQVNSTSGIRNWES